MAVVVVEAARSVARIPDCEGTHNSLDASISLIHVYAIEQLRLLSLLVFSSNCSNCLARFCAVPPSEELAPCVVARSPLWGIRL